MQIYRIAIIGGQLGRIWSKNHFRRQVYQSITAIGYFALMSSLARGYLDETQEFTIGNDTALIKPKQPPKSKSIYAYE